jgi:hypothetical protein
MFAQVFRLTSLAAACIRPPPMADLRAILSTIADCFSTILYCLSATVYFLWWPTSKLVYAVQALLSPVWALLHFVCLPAIYLGHAILTVLLLPFRLQLLDRFEVCMLHFQFLQGLSWPSCNPIRASMRYAKLTICGTGYIYLAWHCRPHRVRCGSCRFHHLPYHHLRS